ncbi:hypothetical protein GRJ2_002357200 [Grus japonensis]|uniref:Uncharacterized protein n=1 Tax=Grus japonensis TaxID=30415 RepID=A0ABC9XMI8_GRUJA
MAPLRLVWASLIFEGVKLDINTGGDSGQVGCKQGSPKWRRPGERATEVLQGASEGRSGVSMSGPRRSRVATVGTGYAFEAPQAMTATVSVSGMSS